MAIGAAAAGGILIWQENQVVKKLRSVNAFSSDTAVKPEIAGIRSYAEKSALKRLVKRGKVKKTENGRYYLPCEDEK